LTLDFSSGAFTKAVTFNGGAESSGDSLKLTGNTFGSMSVTYANANDGTISVSGNSLITYSGPEGGQQTLDLNGLTVADLTLNFSTADDTIELDNAEGPTDISLTGKAGINSANEMGIRLHFGASIQTTGTASTASITLDGETKSTNASGGFGVRVNETSTVQTAGGNIQLTGAGQGSEPLLIDVNAIVRSTGSGNVILNGTRTGGDPPDRRFHWRWDNRRRYQQRRFGN